MPIDKQVYFLKETRAGEWVTVICQLIEGIPNLARSIPEWGTLTERRIGREWSREWTSNLFLTHEARKGCGSHCNFMAPSTFHSVLLCILTVVISYLFIRYSTIKILLTQIILFILMTRTVLSNRRGFQEINICVLIGKILNRSLLHKLAIPASSCSACETSKI